jgi:hypothetical protein
MTRHRRIALLAALAVLAIAVPVLAAPPTDKPTKTAKTPITVSGVIQKAADADGKATYTVTAGGKTYELSAGPKWFFETNPLEAYVGKSVTVDGEIAEGSTDIDVDKVDGTALRAPGKPAWAGGWKRVGSAHPGWSQDKADRMKARFGDCFPPGQCKDKPAHADADDAGDGAGEEPDESEAPEASEAP